MADERTVFSDVAAVFALAGSQWQPKDSGVSRVAIFFSQATQRCRVLALSAERQFVLNTFVSGAAPEQINEAFVAWRNAFDSTICGLNFHNTTACTKFLQAWRTTVSPIAPDAGKPRSAPQAAAPAATRGNVSAGAAALANVPGLGGPPKVAPRTQSSTAPMPQASNGMLPGVGSSSKKAAPPKEVIKKINAKERIALDYDPEIDEDATPISFGRAVHRLEEGLRALLTAAHNVVLNPAYNYDNRAQAAVSYLHQATRALLKLFISKMVQRRKAANGAGEADDANSDAGGGKSVVERILRQVYYNSLNTPTRGVTEEFTLKAASGQRRRLVLRILSLRLRDDFRATLAIGHQMLSSLNAIKLIDNASNEPCRQEGVCMLQLSSVVSQMIKQLTRVVDCIATFGCIARDDDYCSISGGEPEINTKPFWQECAEQKFPDGAKAFSLNQLVLKLTDDSTYDRKFVQTFITTYQSFTHPMVLLSKLMERYQVPNGVVDDKRRQAIQLRVAVVLKYWSDQHFEHFNEDVLKELHAFLTNGLMRDGHTDMANALYSFITNKAKERDEQTAVAFKVPDIIFPPRHKETPTATVSPFALWFELDVQTMAQIITMIDFELYAKVQPTELLNQAWNDRKLKWRAPSLLAMAARSTSLSYWVATVVLSQTKLSQRVHMMSKFVDLAEELRNLNNYQSLMAMLAGLNTAPVHRLKRHWAELPKKKLKLWQDLNDLMSSDSSFKTYRAALDQTSLPALPYVGVHLTDLFFKEDANPDMIDGLINYRKREMVYESIEHIQRFQQVPFQFEMPEPASTFLRQPTSLGEEILYELSLFFEKREQSDG